MDSKDLIKKYLSGETTPEEEANLLDILENDNNPDFDDLKDVLLYYKSNKSVKDMEVVLDYDKIYNSKSKVFKLNTLSFLSAVAVVIIGLSFGLYFVLKPVESYSGIVITQQLIQQKPEYKKIAYNETKNALGKASEKLATALEQLDKLEKIDIHIEQLNKLDIINKYLN